MATTSMALPVEQSTMFYYLELKDGGTINSYPGTAFEKRRKYVPYDVNITDMRSIREDLSLNTAGFQLCEHKTGVKDFSNTNEIKETYYPEVKELIKKVSGADEVHIVSHLCRKSTPAEAQEELKNKVDTDYVTKNSPARFVHIDQSYRGAEQFMFLNLPEVEAQKRMKKRWAIMNVWAPINKPVKRDPLGLCDYRSIDEHDFRHVVVNLPPPGTNDFGNVSKNISHKPRAEHSSNGESAAKFEMTNMAHNPGQRWYYASDMTPEEVWVFKIFDSKKDGRARCTLHSSFPLEGQDDYSDPRTSIEVRCFVFWDDEETE